MPTSGRDSPTRVDALRASDRQLTPSADVTWGETVGRYEEDLIAMLSNWRHSGFQVFCGQRLFPQDETGMENLARYIIRASFSQERMQYLAEPSKVV